jgi:hypothetical protein
MPLSNFLFQHCIDKLVLFDYCQALELGRLDLKSVHRSATTANVLHLYYVSAKVLHISPAIP